MTRDDGRAQREAYEAWHALHPADADADAPWHLLARAHLGPLRGLRVLEIGCGRGGFSSWLACQQPAQVVGADISRTAIGKARALARERQLPDLSFEVADIDRIPHQDGMFDLVVSCETLERVQDPAKAVSELARVLRRGGMLLVTTPNYLGVMGLYRAYRAATGRPLTEVGQPVNNLTLLPRTQRWLRRAGLRIRAVDGVGHYLPVPRRPPVRVRWLDGRLSRWFAMHSLILSEKP